MIRTVYNSYLTTLEMLKDRKYIIDNNIYDINFDIFQTNYNTNKKNIDIYSEKENGEKIYVYFYLEDTNFKKDNLLNLIKYIKNTYEYDINFNIIIVLKDKSNLNILKENKKIELFLLNELVINKTKHKYVPKHILLNDDEITEVLKSYNCSKEELPQILLNDPIAKYYGANVGDIFKIIRPYSSAIGESIFYRIVVPINNPK